MRKRKETESENGMKEDRKRKEEKSSTPFRTKKNSGYGLEIRRSVTWWQDNRSLDCKYTLLYSNSHTWPWQTTKHLYQHTEKFTWRPAKNQLISAGQFNKHFSLKFVRQLNVV